jgi:hypothetical protein
VALRKVLAVNGTQLVLQRGGCGKAVGNRIGVRKHIHFDRLYRRDADMPDAGNLVSLAATHVTELPQVNRLRLLARPDCG